MKALFSALFLFASSLMLQAETVSAEQLRSNLVANTWRELNTNEWTGFGLLFEFNENGTVMVINNTRAEWPAMARYAWAVDVQRENPVITFRDNLGSAFRYTLVPTATGIDLLPFDTESRTVIHLSYGRPLNPVQWTKNQRTLCGAWENTVSATQTNSPVPHLRFNTDGTYVLSWGGNTPNAQEAEAGRWMLSKCSDFIIMMPNDSDTLEYAKVRLISADEMVVEQLMVTKGSLIVKKETKNLFFNKL